jgi:small subunit ribosomal protein S2
MSDATATTPEATSIPTDENGLYKPAETPAELVKRLIDAGAHFGHPPRQWNPKMKPYIHGKRGKFHIIDVKETLKGLLRAKRLIQNTVASGKDVLFVGTKRQARDIVSEHADAANMHYVIERWLGGTLTNFRTIRARLNRLDELDALWSSGEIETYSKKMQSTLGRERTKIKTNLEGIRKMEKMPGVMFIIDTRRERIAVKEAKKLGVTTIALIDTDSDPDLVDLPIPGNDDAMKAIEVIMAELGAAAREGMQGRSADAADKKGASSGEKPKGRSSRARFKADNSDTARTTAGPIDAAEPGRSVTIEGIVSPETPEPKTEPVGAEKATVGLPV